MTRKSPAVLKVALLMIATVIGSRAEGMALLVPAYFSPSSGYWAQLASAARRVPLVAIANIFNGPGNATPRADYVQAMQSVRDAGGQVIGYVYSQYGARAGDIVKADMLRWHQLYPLDGFFVDEMSNTPNTGLFDYYAGLTAYARSLKSQYQVIGNPGTNTEEGYRIRNTADVLMIFEGDQAYSTFAPASWTRKYPPYQFAHLVHAVAGVDDMRINLNLAFNRSAGFIYITDDLLPNPWDRLPTYWAEEVTGIESLNRAVARQVLTNLTIRKGGPSAATIDSAGAAGRYILETGFSGEWTAIATNLTATGTINWAVTNITIPPNRIFRTRQL
jgi:hypothetical protein